MSDGSMLGRFRIASWIVNETRDTVYDGSTRKPNPLEEETAITVPLISLDVRLWPNGGLQAQAAVPLIARTGVVQRPTGPIAFRDEVRGLGDTTAGLWYRASSRGWKWTVNGAISIPTGSTRMPRFRPELEGGSLVPMSRLQRGSGTWDPLFGLVVERGVQGGRWVSSFASRVPLAESRDGLRTGISWEAGSGWAHTIRTHRVMAYGRLDWLHREQDVFNGTPVLVGGGHWLYASPGIAVMAGKAIGVQAEVKLPVHRSLANRQLDSSAIWMIGISRAF